MIGSPLIRSKTKVSQMFGQPLREPFAKKQIIEKLQKIEQSLKEDDNKYLRRTREHRNNLSQERVQSRPLIVFDWPG